MDQTRTGLVGKVLGVVQLLVAVFILDPNSWNGIAVSAVLFLGGVLTLTADTSSISLQKVRSVLSWIAILISVTFIIKLLTVG